MTSRYEFIDAEKATYPIVKMCVWLDVSKSGFYAQCASTTRTVRSCRVQRVQTADAIL